VETCPQVPFCLADLREMVGDYIQLARDGHNARGVAHRIPRVDPSPAVIVGLVCGESS